MRPVPLAGAAALAILLFWRRRKLEPTLLVGGLILLVVTLVYGSGLVQLPNVEKLLEDAGEVLGRWTYLAVAILAFLETGAFVGLLAPGETVMVFGGVVAGQGRIDLITLIAIVWAAAIAGDVTSFLLGRRLGRAFLVKHGPKVSITEERLHHVEGFFSRHGGKAILLGRFVGIVRAIAPFLAGSSGMPLRRFLPYDVIGAGLWSAAFLVLGYVFWQSFGKVVDYAEKGALALGTVIVLFVSVLVAVRWLRDDANRARLRRTLDAWSEKPGVRPVAAVVRPLWHRSRAYRRFVWNRVTPGELGLELTTLSAVFLVGLFTFAGLAGTLEGTRLTTGDARALDLVGDLRTATSVDAAKILTYAGSLTVVAVALLLTAAVLVARRRRVEAAMLVVAQLLTVAAVHAAKAAEGRPRPAGSLVQTAGDSFPSGHAAYAVTWVAIAVVLARAPGVIRGAPFVLLAVLLAAAVGATRIYLRAHYLSDVLAGAGLAAAIFAVCAIVALVVTHVRQNEDEQ